MGRKKYTLTVIIILAWPTQVQSMCEKHIKSKH